MKTRAFVIGVIALVIFPQFLFSQESEIEDYPHNEISVSAGTPTGFGSFVGLFKAIGEGIASGIDKNKDFHTKHTGTYGIDYYYQINSWLRVGGKAIYEGYNTTVNDSLGAVVDKYNISFVSVMPSVQFSYLNRKLVKLYSGVDLGASFILCPDKKEDGTPYTSCQTIFAFNVIPIGIRVGNDKVYGLVETNLGYDAFIKAGIGVRF